MNFNTEEAILVQTKYERGFEPPADAYVISASMVAKDPLQNYLTILYGTQAETEITDSTLGSVFHRGMEEIVKEEKKKIPEDKEHIFVEASMNMKLANGWYLSGTGDIIIRRPDGTSDIEDHKLTKAYALKMIMKDLPNHDYTKQLQVLDLLNYKMNPYPFKDKVQSKLTINVFCKDAKAIDKEKTFTPVIVPNADLIALEQEIVEKTSALQAYIEEGEIPPACPDVWLRKLKNGTTIPTKCALYCSHGKAGVCPHYQPNTREAVARITNW